MRAPALTLLAIGLAAAVSRADAQTYSSDYPVCLHVYGRAPYFECAYTSLAQCNATASGRAAQCDVNPYYAPAMGVLGHAYHRHHRVHRAD